MLERILSWLVVSSLAIGLVRRYLALNRLWIHRREQVVAESISLAALLLSMLTSAPFLLKNALRGDFKGTANELMWVGSNVFMLLVGVGLWVPGQRLSLWSRFVAALRLERRESSALLRRLLWPPGAELVVKILRQMAALDGHLDGRERAYIERFAVAWGVDLGGGLAPLPEADRGHVALRRSVVAYLALSPPRAQVEQLHRMLESLVSIDQRLAPEEELALSELSGLLVHHATGAHPASFRIVIVPQSPDQQQAVVELVPGARPTRHSGGDVFLLESYFSRAYAEVMCQRYRALDLLTLVLVEAGADAASTPADAARTTGEG